MPASNIRVSSCFPGHATLVADYVGGQRGRQEADQLYNRVLSQIAWDEAAQKLVGYIAVNAELAAIDSTASAELLASLDPIGLGYKPGSTAYITCCKVDADQQANLVWQLLRGVFSSIAALSSLLIISHSDLNSAKPDGNLAAHFREVMHRSEAGLWLYECNRNAALPPLQVRRARVEDHDDLLPVVSAAAAGPYSSLAALPASCNPNEPFALTRLIGSQDDQNLVLLAEEDGQLVGLLVATSQLDISLLHSSFDLTAYDGFLPPDVYETCERDAMHAATEKVNLRHQQQQKHQQQEQQQQEPEEVAAAVEAVRFTATGVREELLQLLAEAVAQLQQQEQQDPAAQHRLVAVTVLCMLHGYEHRAVDFLQPIFTEFAAKEYCALSLPHSACEPPIARLMTRLPPLPGSQYPDMLLLMHKAALQVSGSWGVRLAGPEDVVGLHGLIGELPNAVEVQEAFLHALGRQSAFIATVHEEVVGMAVISPTVDLQLLQASFWLHKRLPVSLCSTAEQHAQLEVCVMNPIFTKQVGAMLSGVLQLSGKSCLQYALHLGQQVPDWLPLMQQIPARHSTRAEGKAVDYTLYSFTGNMAYAPKQAVNAQVVIAGASETALSCTEQLLLQPYLSFTSLTLLSPAGVAVGGVAAEYTASLVARMGLEAAVTMIDEHMVAVDAAQKLIRLAGGGQMPYDLLVVTTGLQDQLGAGIAGACPEAAHFVLSSQQLIRGNISHEAAASLASVLLYGADLQAFDVVAALTDAGVSPDAITWMCPDQQQMDAALPLLQTLAAQAGIELPAPQQAQLLGLAPTANGARAVATLQAFDSAAAQQLELDLLVTCGKRGPSAAVAKCFTDAGIVWDGRLVVDAGFKSSYPTVMGAGPAAKFSRRYTLPEVMQEHYNSTEVGAALAGSIAQTLAPSSDIYSSAAAGGATGTGAAAGGATLATACSSGSKDSQQQDKLPCLSQGRVIACRLPGGHVFAFAGCPAAVAYPALAPPAGGRSLISKSKDTQCLINICLDGDDVIYHVAYLGSQAPEASRLGGLVGLQFSYIAAGLKLPARKVTLPGSTAGAVAAGDADADAASSRKGEWAAAVGDESSSEQQQQWPAGGALWGMDWIPTVSMANVAGLSLGPEPGVYVLEQGILAQLAQPWAQLVFHDGFLELRRQLLQQHSATDGDGGHAAWTPGNSVVQQAETAVVQLVQQCRSELHYHVGDLETRA